MTPAQSTSQMAGAARVVVVDDHQPLVDLLVRAAPELGAIEIVGTTTSPREGIELCRTLQPDIVILDLLMPDIPGLKILAEMDAISPESRVLVYSGHLAPEPVREAFLAGAYGFVDKSAGLEELRYALQSVAAGQVYLGLFASEVVKSLVVGEDIGDVEETALTERERTVLMHLANGLNVKELARLLGISVHTVFKHRRNLMRKTGLRRSHQLVDLATRLGLRAE